MHYSGKETAQKFNVSGPRIVQLKRGFAKEIKYRWGERIADEVGQKPFWMNGIIAEREKRACRHEKKEI